MTVPFALRPLHAGFGAEVVGCTPGETAKDESFPAFCDAFLTCQLIVFRGVAVAPEAQVALARRFGEVQVHVMDQYHGVAGLPELYHLSNLGADGRPDGRHPDKGTLYWHTDGSWRDRPGQATLMFAEEVPRKGGDTLFADMYGAFERLSAEWRARIAGLEAIHNLDFSRTRRHGNDPMTDEQRALAPPVAHPIVRAHPETGRQALFLGDHAESVVGMDYDAGRALIEELNALATPDDLVYRHRWRPGDFVIWDNRCLMHRAMPYDTANDRRVMRRCTVLGERPA